MSTSTSRTHRTLRALALLGCAATCLVSVGARADEPAEDPVIAAMAAELDRSMTTLRVPDYDAPYFMLYRVEDVDLRQLTARTGAVHEDDHHRYRRAYVDVRVGDYALDSSEDDEPEWPYEDDYEPLADVPLAAHGSGIRHTLWLLTDLRFKQALSSFMELKSKRLYTPEKKKKRASWSRAPTVAHSDAPHRLTLDATRWKPIIEELSATLASDPAVFDSEVRVSARVDTGWTVTSEGARLKIVEPLYAVHITALTRAADGMLLDKSLDAYGRREADLPGDDALRGAAAEVLEKLRALRDAPELGPYTGPAILEPAATGVFFHEVVGHRLEGHRQDSEEEGQTFADHLGQSIMPAFLSVSDDPTREQHQRRPLNGHYDYDEEAVAASSVMLVRKGVLESFLMGRRPVEGFAVSNGHGRAQGTQVPVARMGTLVVDAHRTVSRARLKKMLLKEVRKRRKPFGLIIKELTGGSTNTSSYGYQAFKGEARMVYKVDAKTGAETLVRGVDIVGTPLTSLQKLVAASDETGVFNGYCGAESGMIPVSTIAPATLFSEIELQRTARGRARGPILGPPGEPPHATTGRHDIGASHPP